MTSIADAVTSLEGDRSTFAAALTAAAAHGTQYGAAAATTRAAQAAVDSAIGRAQAERSAADAATARVAAALTARASAVAAAQAARASADQPLSDATAAALKDTVNDANGGDGAKLDDAVGKVQALDGTIAGMGATEAADLNAAQDDLADKQAVLAEKKAAALALLTSIEGAGASTSTALAAAKDARDRAGSLAAASNDSAHLSAIVAYTDYVARRGALGALKTDGQITTDWNTARDAWLAAAGDVAAAEEVVIEKQLALDLKLAEQTAAVATRPTDAVAKAAEAY